MTSPVGSARVEVEADVRSFARRTREALDRALDSMRIRPVEVPVQADPAATTRAGEQAGEEFADGVTRGADGRLRDARGKFVPDPSRVRPEARRVGEQAGEAFSDGFGTSTLRSTARAFSAAIPRLPGLIGPALITAGVGIASGIAVAAAAVLGSLLGAALAAAGGLGVIGLGAFLLREEPGLKSAAKSLMDTVKDVFTDAAQPLLEPLSDSLGVFEDLVRRIGPQTREMFASIAPAVVPFAEGLAGLVENSLPGFLGLVRESAPLVANLGGSLSDLGNDFAAFFTEIADASPELDIFLQDAIDGFGNLIIELGRFIGWSARAYVAIKDLLENGFESDTFEQITESFRSFVTNGIDFVVNNLPRLIDQFLDMKTQVLNAAIDIALGIAEALPRVVPQIAAVVVQLITKLVTGLTSAIPKVVEAAGLLVTGLVDGIVSALPVLIPAAVELVTGFIVAVLQSIPVLIDAGLRLVRGLVSGILQALPEIVLAIGQAIPRIISAFLEALPSILLLGVELMTAIIQGIGDALPQVADELRNNVIPTLLETLRTEGPKLIEQGGEALKAFMQGFVENMTVIQEVLTGTIIPELIGLIRDSPEFLQAGIDILEGILQGFAENVSIFTDFLSNEFVPAMTEFIQNNPEVIEAGIALLVVLVEAMIDNIGLIVGFVSDTLIPVLVAVIIESSPALAEAGGVLIKEVAKGMLRSLPGIVTAGNRVGGSILSALGSFGMRMAQAGTDLLIRFAGGMAGPGLARVRIAAQAVQALVTRFFGAAGSWLVDAGRRIIDGLANGISAGFGRIRSLLGGLTAMLPDWKGPAQVDSRILYPAGRKVMASFGLGLVDGQDAIRRSLQELTADLPAWTAPGATPRGGDGASAGGGMTIVFEPGAIVVQGTGREAGIETAEAILERLAQEAGVR